MESNSWWNRALRKSEQDTSATNQEVMPPKFTKEEWKKKCQELRALQTANWKKHFAEHPDQLKPGAEVKRRVPIEEADLLAQVIWNCPESPDEGEWTETVDY